MSRNNKKADNVKCAAFQLLQCTDRLYESDISESSGVSKASARTFLGVHYKEWGLERGNSAYGKSKQRWVYFKSDLPENQVERILCEEKEKSKQEELEKKMKEKAIEHKPSIKDERRRLKETFGEETIDEIIAQFKKEKGKFTFKDVREKFSAKTSKEFTQQNMSLIQERYEKLIKIGVYKYSEGITE